MGIRGSRAPSAEWPDTVRDLPLRSICHQSPRCTNATSTHVVRHVLPAKVVEHAREVAVRQLETVVDSPQRRTETIADAREATARGRVGLEHHELLPQPLGDARRVEVWLDNLLAGSMAKIVCKDSLWILDGAEIAVRELCGAVLVGITVVGRRHQQLRGPDGGIRTAPWLQR